MSVKLNLSNSLNFVDINNKKKVFYFFRFFVKNANNLITLNLFNFLSLNGNTVVSKKIINFVFFNFLKFFKISYNNNKTKLYILDKNILVSRIVLLFYNQLRKQLQRAQLNFMRGNICKLNFIGLGYKVFLYKDSLYLKLGYCRIIKLSIPSSISVFIRKRNSIILLSENQNELSNFVYKLKHLRKFDFYKGKGIFEYSNFDGIKLKVGKQQQFY